MYRRSLTGAVLLIVIGAALLASNLGALPGPPALFADYWPWLLVVWGGFRLAELFASSLLGVREAKPAGGGAIVLALALSLAGFGARQIRAHAPDLLEGLAIDAGFAGERYGFDLAGRSVAADPAGRVEIQGVRGSVHVVGGDGDEVRVAGRVRVRGRDREEAALKAPGLEPTVLRQGETVRVDAPRDNGLRYELEITAPRGSSLLVWGVGIDRLDGEDLAQVEIDGSVERIRLRRIAGTVRIDGNLFERADLEEIGGSAELLSRRVRVAAAAVPGSVSLDGDRLHLVEAVDPQAEMKGEGRLELVRPSGSARVFLERGRLRVEPGPEPAPMEARGIRADVEAELDPRSRFSVEALAVRGLVRDALGEPESTAEAGEELRRDSPAGPGPRIRLESEGGDVILLVPGGPAA